LVRITGRLAVVGVVAALWSVGGMTAPAARAGASTSAVAASPSAQTTMTRAATAAPAASGPVGVQAAAAELADAATGADLWSRSSVTERAVGSIAKVMTAYVVLTTPGVNLGRLVTVPSGIVAYDEEYDASTAGLEPGEKYTTAQLLYALLLPSGCDAAYTLASAYGPGLGGFVAKMNAAARQLGLTKTHFTDFSGLPDPSEYATYSTAHDLINLGRAAMRLEPFATIVATRQYTAAATGTHARHLWRNLNPLLGAFSGAAGIKTGYTAAAGQCLLFEAKRGTTTLIGVVLDSSPVNSASLTAAASDATALLDWGFYG
jgi:D-alanyl-D-alanine carboxypeptidase (penicillin-binding protein 5/6)